MKRIRRTGCLLATAFATLVLSLPAFSQGTNNGRILGTVTDQTGGVIAGSTVTITDTARGTTRTLTTDSAGEYNAPELIPGTYTVRANSQGFKATERQNIGVEVGSENRVDIQLQPGDTTQTVTVTEALPLVETANATLGGTISNQLIGDLPVQGRNFTKLLELRPGVYLNPGSGKWSQSSNGMRNEHNVYILDGIDSIEGFSSQSVVNATGIFGDATAILPIDAIEEFNTQEVPKAEYGWKPGAIVSVGLRSGTNAIHGSAYAFGRDSALDAENPFLTPGTPKQETAITDFGGTVGGPIVKDKVFYFLGYEGQRNQIGSPSASIMLPTTVSLLSTQTSATALAHSALDACNALTTTQLAGSATPGTPSPLSMAMAGLTFNGVGNCVANSNNTGVFQSSPLLTYSADPVGDDVLDGGISKIDYHPNEKNTITGDYFAANYDSVAPQNNGAAQNYWDTNTHAKSMVFGLHWTWVPSSSVVNELRGGFNRYNQQSFPADCLSSEPHPNYTYLSNFNSDSNALSGVGLPANCGFPNITISPLSAMGCCGSFPKIQGPDWTKQVIDDVAYTRGRHSFKFGFETRNLTYNGGTYGGSKGTIAFSSLQNFLLGTFVGETTAPSVLVGQPGTVINEWGYAAYAQDDWRIFDRLMLNLGMRYETVTPFTAAGNQLGNFDPSSATGLVQANGGLWKRNNDFSPRVGLAWDVKGDSKWVVRSGFSMIYVIEGYNAFVSQQGLAGISVLGLNFDPTGALLGGVAGPGNITTGTVVFPTGTVANGAGGGLNWTGNANVFTYPAAPGIRCDSPTGTAPNNKPCPILAVNPNFYRPYAPAWNISFQHPFSSTTSLQVAYVGSHGTGLLSLNDINAPAFGSGWATYSSTTQTCTPLTATAIATTVGAASSTTPSVSATCENLSRPYFSKFPYLSQIIEIGNQDESNYNALQATFTQRPWHGISDLIGFTYGHALEDASGDWNGSGLNTNPFNVKESYGNSSNDVRDRLTMSITYALPEKKGYKQMLEGWGLNSVVNLQSALPYTVTDATNDISGIGDKTDWWNFFGNPKTFDSLGSGYGTSNIPYTASNGDPKCAAEATALDAAYTPLHPGWTYTNALAKYGCYDLDGSMMLPPAFGTLGDAGRGVFRAVGLKLWDLSVTKQVHFTERISGQFRFEAFNILNHTNYAAPSATMSAGVTATTFSTPTSNNLPTGNLNFGRSTATPDVSVSNPSVGSGAPRGFQMGLRLAF